MNRIIRTNRELAAWLRQQTPRPAHVPYVFRDADWDKRRVQREAEKKQEPIQEAQSLLDCAERIAKAAARLRRDGNALHVVFEAEVARLRDQAAALQGVSDGR